MKTGDERLEISKLEDRDLIRLRAALDVEMRKREIAFSVGDVGEQLAVDYFRRTPGLPNLQCAPRGTKNVDALSRSGDRYSIKTVCQGKKTGTIYPDPNDLGKTLFEYLLVVKLSDEWLIQTIHQFTWEQFCEVRRWDKRMNAWYVPFSSPALSGGVQLCLLSEEALTG